jgi:DNA-binding response OmpR family regulator
MNSATNSGPRRSARDGERAVGVAETAQDARTVLVIEDEPSVSAFLRAALQRRGYQVVTSSSASEGLDLLRRGRYLGVISDVRTPGAASGTEVYAWIRESAPELLRRLVFITGDIVNEQTSKLLAESGAPVVVKPFRVSELISAVEQTIGKPSKEENG